MAYDDRLISIYRPCDYSYKRAYDCPYYSEEKHNGRWVRFTNLGGGPLRAHGHRQNDMGHLTYIDCSALRVDLPPETVVDGELVWPGHFATEVITALKECPEALQFHAFSVPVLQSTDLTGYEYIEARKLVAQYFPLPSIIKRFETRPDLDEALAAVLPNTEGIVLKGCWYSDWWKVKPLHDIDVVVTAIQYGTAGKWAGLPHSIRVGVYCNGRLCDLGTVGIFKNGPKLHSHEIILALTEGDVGRVCQVEYQAVTSGCKLQHAKFIDWRDDKPAEACTKDQLPDV